MSFNPPPPPPPPPGGGGFRPPPPRQPGGGFAPPPPAGGGFAPPPPRPGGGFAPPPPPQNNGGMQQVNQGMSNMGFRPTNPGPPQGFQAPGAPQPPGPGMFQPPQGPGGSMGPPPPGQAPMPPPPGASMGPPPPHQQAPQQGGMPQPPGPSSQFYQQPQNQGPMQRGPAPGGPPGGAPMMGGGQGAPQPFQENIDFNIQIPDRLCRFTCSKIPQTAALSTSSKIPLGGILRPLAPCANSEDDDVPIVQPGNAGIIRCKRCRTYINAFVHWSEQGRRWRCNICAQANETPAAYFCHLDEKGLRRDRMERPELCEGAVEFIAPAEYMVRPPQEPSYFFVIDVSATAVRSGMLTSVANSIKESLDNLPGGNRTKIGFITFDNSVHYYNLDPDQNQPQMMVVSDLNELFVPLPTHLLVNLKESRPVVDSFLDALPEMFAKKPVVSQSCLGPALKAAFTVMKQIGGKMCVFQSIMPNIGDGALKPRENPGMMGTPNEVKILRPMSTWYKDTAIEFSRQQISVDMFLFPYQYMDLAALGELPQFTNGTLHSYVSFNPQRDAKRFEEQLHKTLVQQTAFEAVMRIRCTKGMRITNFYGNFNIRGTDLMALPNVNTESVFAFDLAHDEQSVTSNYVTIQAALLYTSSNGERRIRVMTQALPVTSLSTELVAGVDAMATCNLLSKQGVDVGIKTNMDNARIRMQQTCVDMIRTTKGGDRRTVSGYAVPGAQNDPAEDGPLPKNFELLPLYTLAMMKNVAFRGGTDVHPDERIQAHHLVTTMWVDKTKNYMYPRLFALHQMDQSAGTSIEDVRDDDDVAGRNNILLPKAISLTINHLSSDGIYLLDNGVDMYLWVGREANPGLVSSLFGLHSLEGVDINQVVVQTDGDDFAVKVGAIMHALREDIMDPYTVSAKIQIVREGDGQVEGRFFWFFVEDSASFQGGTFSYDDFMQFVQNPGNGSAAPPGGARGPPGAPAPRGMAPPGPQGQPMRAGPPAPMPQTPSQPMAPQRIGGPPAPMGSHGMGGGPPAPMGAHGMGGPPSQHMPPRGMGGPPPQMAPRGMGGPPMPPQGMGGPPQAPPAPPQQYQHAPQRGGMPPPQRGPPSGPPAPQGRSMGGPPPPPPPPGAHRSAPPGPPRGMPPPPPPPPGGYR